MKIKQQKPLFADVQKLIRHLSPQAVEALLLKYIEAKKISLDVVLEDAPKSVKEEAIKNIYLFEEIKQANTILQSSLRENTIYEICGGCGLHLITYISNLNGIYYIVGELEDITSDNLKEMVGCSLHTIDIGKNAYPVKNI